MFTGVFKDRSRSFASAALSPNDALARLLQARSLRPHRFLRNAEVGPFVVDHVCRAQGVIVELHRGLRAESEPRRQARIALLQQLGFQVLLVTRQEVATAPERVLAQVRAALR